MKKSVVSMLSCIEVTGKFTRTMGSREGNEC